MMTQRQDQATRRAIAQLQELLNHHTQYYESTELHMTCISDELGKGARPHASGHLESDL